jgi:hypothetical protein
MEGSKTLFYSSKFQSFFETIGARALKKAPFTGLIQLFSYVNTVDLVTLKLIANKHTALSSSPHPVGPSASPANYYTGQTTMHFSIRISDLHFRYVEKIACRYSANLTLTSEISRGQEK